MIAREVVLRALSPRMNPSDLPLHFSGAEFDSRRVVQGQIFFAFPGERVDGHDYVNEAYAAGAVCAVVERPVDVPIVQIEVGNTCEAFGKLARCKREQWSDKHVIAITGSVGKTTTKEMVARVCAMRYRTYATTGNYNNFLGLSHTVLNTPDDAEVVVLELGISAVSEMDRLVEIAQPTMALVTCIEACHLDGLGSELVIAQEKSKIYSLLSAEGVAWINNQSAYTDVFLRASVQAQQKFCFSEGYLLHDRNILLDEDACATFSGVIGGQALQCQLHVPGVYQVQNAYMAARIGHYLGIEHAALAKALSAYHGYRGRMQIHRANNSAVIIDDSYNASPQSVREAIRALASMRAGRKCMVFADMSELSDQTEKWHQQVGEWANSYGVDCLWTLGSCSELTQAVFHGTGQHFLTKAELEDYVQQQISPGTILLVKGSRSWSLEDSIAIWKMVKTGS